MRVASVKTLYIPATMWLSLSCGMELFSAVDLIISLQSFPSRALTTTADITNRLTRVHLCASPLQLNTLISVQTVLYLLFRSSQVLLKSCTILCHIYYVIMQHGLLNIFFVFLGIYLSIFSWTFLGPRPSDFSTVNLPLVVSCFLKRCSPLYVWRPWPSEILHI